VATVQGDVDYVKDAAVSAFATAKGYVGSAGGTVAQYIPSSVSAYLPASLSPQTSLSKDAHNGLEDVSGEGLAKLPEERLQEDLPSHDNESGVPLGRTAGAGPLPGTPSESGVAVLPEEKHVEESSSGFQSSTKQPEEHRDAVSDRLAAAIQPAGQSYLNPLFTQEEERTENVKPVALPARNVPENTYAELAPQDNHGNSSKSDTGTNNADTDASTRSLAGSRAETGIPPTPPPKSEKNEFETLREHDSLIPSNASPSAVLISSAKEHSHHGKDEHKNADGSKVEPTVSRSAGECSDKDPNNTSANKPINTSPRTHPLANSPAEFNQIPLGEPFQAHLDANPGKQLSLGEHSHGKLVGASVPESEKGKNLEINSPRAEAPVVPEKLDTKRVDSTTATAGHEHGAGGGGGIPVPGAAAKTAASAATGGLVGGGSTKHGRSKSEGSNGSLDGSPKKVGFMNKVKAEMKILSGKLGHHEDKVEEGKRILGKN